MFLNHLLPLLLLSGLSSPVHSKDQRFGWENFEFDEAFVGCLPRQQQQMIWRLRKLGYITKECYALQYPPACEDAPDAWDASFSQILTSMSENVGPTMQLLSLMKMFQGFPPAPEDVIEINED